MGLFKHIYEAYLCGLFKHVLWGLFKHVYVAYLNMFYGAYLKTNVIVYPAMGFILA